MSVISSWQGANYLRQSLGQEIGSAEQKGLMMQSQPMTNVLKALWELLVQICVQRKKNLESEIEVQQQQDTYPFWKSQTRIYASASGTFCSMQTPHYWKVSPVFRAGYSPENLLTHMPTHWNHPHRPDH